MKPLDPRLLRHSSSARWYIALAVGLGGVAGLLVAAQSWALAQLVGTRAGSMLWLLAALFGLRALLSGAQERYGRSASRKVIGELREKLVRHLLRRKPEVESGRVEQATVATQGLEALAPYFESYLPQLLLATLVTPALLLCLFFVDRISGWTICVSLPLIPLFMILVGRFTQQETSVRLAALRRLNSQLLDLIAGLNTLRALGREHVPVPRLRTLGEAHRQATMATLRRAFLSGLVLELVTTLSVAAVAVGVGLRLVNGTIDLPSGLWAILLAPEILLPLRQVGAQFHASANGVAAAEQAFALLESPVAPPVGSLCTAPSLATQRLELHGVAVTFPGRAAPTIESLSLQLDLSKPSMVALVGPSGAGKTTALKLLLGLTPASSGSVELRSSTPSRLGDCGLPLQRVELATYWAQIAWLPQRPGLVPGTVLTNVLRGRALSTQRLEWAAAQVGFDEVLHKLPQGWSTPLGQGGYGLSLGQRQRLALTRALAGDEPLLLLDEPTAHLDSASEQVVLKALRLLRSQGRTLVVVTHREALRRAADRVVEMRRRSWLEAA